MLNIFVRYLTMVDQNTHFLRDESYSVFCFMECQQDTTIPSPSVVLKFPLIQKVCHLYLLQGSDFFLNDFFFININLFFFWKNKRSHRVMWLNSVLFVLCFKWTRCLTLFVKSDHLRFISDTEVYSIFLIHKVYILLMIKLLWSVIRLYLCVCFVKASIYTNTSRYTNLHTTFYYKPILIICIKLKKKSMYKSKTYLTKKILLKIRLF